VRIRSSLGGHDIAAASLSSNTQPGMKRGIGVAGEDGWIAAGLAAITLAVTLFFAPRGFHGGFVDIGHDGYQLRQVLDLVGGAVIFRDTFDQYGLLNGYLNAAGFLAFGRRLLAMKYFICGWYALSAMAIFMIARHWLERWLAAFSVLVWLGLAPFYNHGIMISPNAYALLFQAVATLIVLRTPDLAPRRFAQVGLLAGLSWAVKQAMGVLYLGAILCWLLIRPPLSRAPSRAVVAAAAAASAGFFAVIAVALAWLWMNGAIGDWYLQTIVFPRRFYVSGAPPRGLLDVLDPLWNQFTQPLYWVLIRAAVLLLPLLPGRRGHHQDAATLMAFITAFLWLGAYPSVNFMHQWWTASLTIAPFVLCVREGIRRLVPGGAVAAVMTIAVTSAVVAAAVVERAHASVARVNTLTETLTAPPLFRGIRTDVATRRAFESLYHSMTRYRAEHPGIKVVSIETADGWGNGMVESLPLLSFFDDNTHAHPVYWSLPLLSTSVYPQYAETLWRRVREQRPLIVDHRQGIHRPFEICGYRVLEVVQSDRGHWYVYAAESDPAGDQRAHPSNDEWVEYGCSEDGTGPTLRRPPSTSVTGAWRGAVAPSAGSSGRIGLATPFPLELADRALRNIERAVDVYTWPARLAAVNLDRRIEPVSTDVTWRADIVREFQPGAWTVDGLAERPFSYLLQWDEEAVGAGTCFAVRGELFEGGLQAGFLNHGQWFGWISITRPGQFEGILDLQKPGRYSLVVSNYIDSSWRDLTRRHPMGGLLGLLGRGFLPNRFRVAQAGWIRPRSGPD
jgi:hypothetical protein